MRARLMGPAVLASMATAVVLTTAASGEDSSDDDYGAAAAGCDVTETQVVDIPRTPNGPRSGVLAGDGLWLPLGTSTATVLASTSGRPDGSVTAYPGRLRANGSIRSKFLWRRAKKGSGRLWIMGHSQPGTRQFRIDTGDAFPWRKFVPSSMIFPGPGCWSVTAKSGKARISFVAWVAVAP